MLLFNCKQINAKITVMTKIKEGIKFKKRSENRGNFQRKLRRYI